MSARTVMFGFAVGLIYKTANLALKGWKDVASVSAGGAYKGATAAVELSPELLGVGYIIGPRIAATMAAGGVLAYLVLMPLIHYFGDALDTVVAPGWLTFAGTVSSTCRSRSVAISLRVPSSRASRSTLERIGIVFRRSTTDWTWPRLLRRVARSIVAFMSLRPHRCHAVRRTIARRLTRGSIMMRKAHLGPESPKER